MGAGPVEGWRGNLETWELGVSLDWDCVLWLGPENVDEPLDAQGADMPDALLVLQYTPRLLHRDSPPAGLGRSEMIVGLVLTKGWESFTL